MTALPVASAADPPDELEVLRAHAASLHSLQEDSANFVLYQLALDPTQPHGARVVLVSPSIRNIVGIRDPHCFESWFENIHPDDIQGMLDANRRALENGEMYDYSARVYNPAKGAWVWVRTVSTPVTDARGQVTHYNGVILDITPQKEAEAQREAALKMLQSQIALEAAQSHFLELLTEESSLCEALHALVGIIEGQFPGMLGLILLLDEDGRHLHHGAAVSLPDEYCRSIEGLEIGPAVGSCGTAAFSRRRVIVEDIASDARWEGLRDLGLKYGLRACWSQPVLAADGRVLGTFAMYYLEPRAPSEPELFAIETAAHLARVAIEYKRAQQALREAYATLASAVATERSRIARDLHDSVTQTLFSANLIAGVLPKLWDRDPLDGRRKLEQLHRLTSGALAEMRTLLVELRPAALLEAPLGDLLRQLAEATTGRIGAEIMCEQRREPGTPSGLSPDVQIALYRIAQEALNNLAKHSRAKTATVRLCLAAGRVELSVCDSGIGFDPARIPPDHLGVGIMRERAEAIGAQLSIDSRPGEGTRVVVVWNACPL